MKEFNERFVRKNLVTLTKISKNSPALTPYPVNISVDTSLIDLTVSLTGGSPKLNVYNPQGNVTRGERKEYPNLVVVNYKVITLN